jgi:hypothetical protein
MKLCKDCKHYCGEAGQERKWWDLLSLPHPGLWYLCEHPDMVNPCTGGPVDSLDLRNRPISLGGCGKEGKYWEPK